jgi:hypothetical protein
MAAKKILAVSLGPAVAAPITTVDAYAKRGYRHHYRLYHYQRHAVRRPQVLVIQDRVKFMPLPEPVTAAVLGKPLPEPLTAAVLGKPPPEPVTPAVLGKPLPEPLTPAVLGKPLPEPVTPAVLGKPPSEVATPYGVLVPPITRLISRR